MRLLAMGLISAALLGVILAVGTANIHQRTAPSNTYNLRDLGGDPTADADSAPALKKILQKCKAQCSVAIPAGKYRFSSAIEHTFDDERSSISIVGAGADATILNWPNTGGGLSFTWKSIANSLRIRDVSLTTSQASGGTAIALLNSTKWAGYQIDTQKHVERVTFRGDDGSNVRQYWTRAVYSQAVNYVNFNEIMVYGGGDGITKQGYGIVLSDIPGIITANFNIIGSSFLQLDTGLLTIDDPQGIAITNSTFVDNEVGIATRAGSSELQGMLISTSNFNNRRYNVNLQTQVNDVQIIGNTFITQDDAPLPSFGVVLGNVARFTFVGNNFITFSSVTDPALKIDQTHGWPGVVADNNFSGPFSTAIELTSRASRIVVQGNAFSNIIKSKVVNAGQHNAIDVVQSWVPTLNFGSEGKAPPTGHQLGTYARYGDLVVATFRISLASKGANRGNAVVTGFPFGTAFPTSGLCGLSTNLKNAVGGLSGYITGNTFQLTSSSTTGIVSATDENFSDQSELNCTVSYLASP